MRDYSKLTPEERADLVCLERFDTVDEAHQAGSVILAMGEWYVVLPEGGGFGLHVRSAVAKSALPLVQRFLEENRSAGGSLQIAGERAEPRPVPAWHLVPYPLLIMAIFWLSNAPVGSGWSEAGRFDSEAIRLHGEWWRLLTPLFFHVDAMHVLGNVMGGLCFGGLLASRIGVLRTYGVALGTGIAGNALNLITFWNTPRWSMGASTAVFGLLGALFGLRLGEGLMMVRGARDAAARRHDRILRAGWLAIGLVLLAWMGTGGERTDVTAHLYGFLSGVILLLFARVFSQQGRENLGQFVKS